MITKKIPLEDFRQSTLILDTSDNAAINLHEAHVNIEDPIIQPNITDAHKYAPDNNTELLDQFTNAELIKQNSLLEASLNEIKTQLIAIEKSQDIKFSQLSASIVIFIKNLADKIFSKSTFTPIIANNIISHIDDVLKRIKSQSKISISIPENFNIDIKEALMMLLKQTASNLNIDIIEHKENDQNIKLNWTDGRAEFQVDQTLKIIEEEVGKFNTLS